MLRKPQLAQLLTKHGCSDWKMRIQAVLILQPGKWKHHLPRLVTQECLECLLNGEATSVNVCFCEKQLISTYCITYINVLEPITRCTNIRIAIDIYWVNFRPIILSAQNKYKSWMEWQACWNFWSPQLRCGFVWCKFWMSIANCLEHFNKQPCSRNFEKLLLIFGDIARGHFRRIWPLNVFSV